MLRMIHKLDSSRAARVQGFAEDVEAQPLHKRRGKPATDSAGKRKGKAAGRQRAWGVAQG